MASPAVLVVDDNEVNRAVLRCMLDGLGLPPHEACDGGQAVHLARAASFDLILMDCMMPGMDGLTATRAIRTDGCSRDAWVIAVTANTLVHDRERCLAAGMDDYIAKPFTLDILTRALTRWTELRQTGWRCPAAAAHANDPGPETDFTSMHQLAALAGHQAVVEVVGVFLGECDALVARLQEAGSDPAQLHRIGHRIKGACASVGLVRAQRLAAALEARARAGDEDGACNQRLALVQALRDGCRALRALIEPRLNGRDPRP